MDAAPEPSGPGAHPAIAPLFVASIFAGSFLLFLVQPMVARMALPRLGGAPSVWNSAMLVYQALLLAGYGYAHLIGRISPRAQGGVHLAVLLAAALWLPIGLIATELPADAQPALWVPWLLGLSIGPLFFAVSAQAPLLQRWYASASGGRDPYALYAASNLGSFGGLIAYPLLVEPLLAVQAQRWLWSAGYVAVILLIVGCAALLPRAPAQTTTLAQSPAPTRLAVARWVLLAFVPSGLMLAATTYITTDIVAMPLLWVIPLGLYLLSFSIAFASNRAAADIISRIAPLVVLLFGGIMVSGFESRAYLNAILALILLFTVSVALHTVMYRARPAADRLTGFYLAMSLGGALGGVFAALIAPLLFDWTWEYPLLILLAGVLVPQELLIEPLARPWSNTPQRHRIMTLAIALAMLVLVWLSLSGMAGLNDSSNRAVVFMVIAGLGLVALGHRTAFMTVLVGALVIFGGFNSAMLSLHGNARTRSYFGVYTVRATAAERQLAHGTTVHGTELIGSAAREVMPTTYYVPGSGVGQAMTAAPKLFGPHARIGVVGLGAGTLACYAQNGQRWRIFEIDPAIVRIARTRFGYLRRCLPGAEIVIGDARLALAAQPAATLDLLALDAFSSDAVPIHLMTREAFAGYARVLSPRGLLLVHISNRFIALGPVVAANARAGGWGARVFVYRPGLKPREGETVSEWIALSRDSATLAKLTAGKPGWKPLAPRAGFAGWSDDHSSILPLLK
ncbi:MAG: hypothetical protein C0476_05950 [Sphingomonas sp.]|nr:hypothetical protein [Sphingomonas sp.]